MQDSEMKEKMRVYRLLMRGLFGCEWCLNQSSRSQFDTEECPGWNEPLGAYSGFDEENFCDSYSGMG